MMTMENTTPGAERIRVRCVMKAGEGRCWREPTERLVRDDPDHDVCAEHYRAFMLHRRADELHDTLADIGSWRLSSPDCQTDSRLHEHTAAIFTKALEEYWSARVEAFAADLVAIRGEEDEPLSPEDARRLAAPWLLADELLNAHVTLEDMQGVPPEAFRTQGRWAMVAAISVARDKAGEKHDRIRAEIRPGLRPD